MISPLYFFTAMPARSFTAFITLVLVLPSCLGRAVERSNNTQSLSSRALAAVYTNCVVPNTVALTFDDGPARYHTEVANTLSDAGILGTFFVNGLNFDCIYDPPQVSAIRASFQAGHQFASHTWSHPDLTTLSQDQIRQQLDRINLALERILGVVPTVMRPPYGNYNNDVLTVVDSVDQSVVMWSFDSGDSLGVSPSASKEAYTTLVSQRPQSIISLQHETIETTVHDVLPFAIQTLKDAGYNFATISECLGIPAYQVTRNPGVRNSSWTCV